MPNRKSSLRFFKALPFLRLVAPVGLVALVASGALHAAMPAKSKTKEPVKIGFILATLQEERYLKDRKYFEAAAKAAGAEVLFASCNNNEQTQAAQVDSLLSQGVKTLVIQAVNGKTAAGFVKQAKADGVKVVAYDRLIEGAPLDAFITEDAVKVGRLQAEAAVKATGGKGNYVILMGQAGDPNAADRTRGITEVLKKYPGVKVVSQQSHAGWSPELALKTVENALTQNKNQVAAILANNSGMAQGAVRALTDQMMDGKIFLAGADADLASIRHLVSGKQSLEILIPIQEMAENAARVAVALARNEPFKFQNEVQNGSASGIKAVETPAYAVTQANLDEKIFKSGFHSREAVYGNPAPPAKP